MRKSVYCRGPVRVSGSRSTSWSSYLGKAFSVLMVIILAAATVVSGITKESKADDNWFVNVVVCGNDLGLNTAYSPRLSIGKTNINEDSGYNKLTMQDVYGGKLAWTTFNGTREPGKIKKRDDPNDKHSNILSVNFNDGGTASKNGVAGRVDSDIYSGADDVHDFSCPVRALTSMFAGTILGAADMISDFTSLFVKSAVDPSFICDDPANPEGMCINLLAVIAGKGNSGSDGGIIGRLFDGMYSGLIVMVFAAVGVWAAWNGLIKRKLTSALSGIAWAVAIFGVGVFFMSQPLFLAKLPMQIGTSLGGCVVMGMNGKNCMSTDNGTPTKDAKNTECYVDTNDTIPMTEAMALNAKMASCKVWKAFVWEPWVAGQFGASYNELFTGGGGGDAGPLFQNSKTKDNLEYWKDIKVGLYTTDGTMSQMCADTRDGNDQGYNYSNVALYQANLQAEPGIHACGTPYHAATAIKTDEQVYGDWLWIIDAMTQARSTQDQTGADNLSIMWASWTGNNVMGRIQIAFIALGAAIMGAAVLITTAVLGMVYLFMSVLLTAFAPLFFLMGVMPGQGKKLFLGWVEKMVSNTLKYFGCILWMMVTLELYAAVLGNANNNIGMTFIFTIIVTLAMWLYRGEFLKMIGHANLGGTQFSNSMSDWMKKKGKSIKDTAVSTGAGYVGGLVAGRSAPKEKINRHKFKVGDTDANGNLITSQAQADSANEERKKQNKKNREYNRRHGRRAGARDGAMYQLNQNLKGKGGVLGQAAIVNDRIRDDRRNRSRKQSQDQKKQVEAMKNSVNKKIGGYGVVSSEKINELAANSGSEQDMIRSLHNTAEWKAKQAELAKRTHTNAEIQAHAKDALDATNAADALRSGKVGAALGLGEIMDKAKAGAKTGGLKEDEAKALASQFNQLAATNSDFASSLGDISADDIQKMAMNDPSLDTSKINKLNKMQSDFESDAVAEYNASHAASGKTYSMADIQKEDAFLQTDKEAKLAIADQDTNDQREAQRLQDEMNLTDKAALASFNLNKAGAVIEDRADDLNAKRLGLGATNKDRKGMRDSEQLLNTLGKMDGDGNMDVDINAINRTFGGTAYGTTSAPSAGTFGLYDTVDVHDRSTLESLANGTKTFEDYRSGGHQINPRSLSPDNGNQGQSFS